MSGALAEPFGRTRRHELEAGEFGARHAEGRSGWESVVPGLAFLPCGPYLSGMKSKIGAEKRRHKNITRFDYGNTHGWWVRFQRTSASGAERLFSKMFSDAVHGGTAKALRAAIAWRDQTAKALSSVPRPRKSHAGYIKQVELARRGGPSRVYLAWIRLPDGRAASTTFSIAKWGKAAAKRRCQQYLERKRREAA